MLDRDALKRLTSEDFVTFGIGRIAFVKQVQDAGEEAFAICHFDGSVLGVASSQAAAVIAIERNDFEPHLLH